MRKGLIAMVVIVVLLAGGVLFWGLLPWHARQNPLPSSGQASLASRVEENVPPPLPDISLQINSEHELTEFLGTPLIFSIRLSNPRAVNAEAANQAERTRAQNLQGRVARGEVSKEQAASQLASFPGQHTVQPVVLGSESTGWAQFIRIVQLPPGNTRQPIPWAVKLAVPPASKVLTLDARNTAQLDYLIVPETAARIAPGEYKFLAVLEVPADSNIPADRWRGRMESRPVKLTVTLKPARLAPAEEEKISLQFAQYYKAAGELAAMLQAAQNALKANAHSVFAHILIGEAQEAQGNLQPALESYQTALSEFHSQHPDSYEPPVYLIEKTLNLSRQLEQSPTKAHGLNPRP